MPLTEAEIIEEQYIEYYSHLPPETQRSKVRELQKISWKQHGNR